VAQPREEEGEVQLQGVGEELLSLEGEAVPQRVVEVRLLEVVEERLVQVEEELPLEEELASQPRVYR